MRQDLDRTIVRIVPTDSAAFFRLAIHRLTLPFRSLKKEVESLALLVAVMHYERVTQIILTDTDTDFFKRFAYRSACGTLAGIKPACGY